MAHLFFNPLAIALITLVGLTGDAWALKINLKKVAGDIANIVKQSPKIINPILTPISIATGKVNPLDIKDFLAQQGKAIGSITESTRNLAAIPDQMAASAISKVAGDKALIVYELATTAGRIQREFAFTATGQAAAALQGQDPLISLAMPLAAALRDAYNQQINGAKPFPKEVIDTLSPILPPDILLAARFTTNNLRITLPSAINQGNLLFDNEHAVTVDNLIIFTKEPDFDDIDDLVFVSHELFHVKQYKDWGVDKFAFNYLKNSRAIEDQAKAAASFVRSYLEQIARGQPPVPQITHQSASAFATSTIQTPLGTTVVFNATAGVASSDASLTQQVFVSPQLPTYDSFCSFSTDTIFITPSNQITSSNFGFAPVGFRTPPFASVCFHDLVFNNGARYCVLYNGAVVLGMTKIAQCAACAPGLCP